MALHYTPLRWRESRIVFIPKPGKDSYDSPKSFRPISLSNYMLKGLERLAVWHMDLKVLENPIHSRQHGFRSDRSTETAISEVANYIEMNVFKRRFCVGVFLDIKGAFDNIKPQCVYESLREHGSDPDMAAWYLDLLIHRNISYTLGDINITRTISRGFPQGGVTSAKFWLIAFNGAVEIINSRGIKGTAFWEMLACDWGLPSRARVDDTRLVLHQHNFRVVMDSFGGDRRFLTPTQYNLFTDGSKTGLGVGAGAVLYHNKQEVASISCKLADSSTAFDAEILGVSLGVRLIMERLNTIRPRFLKIYCDSQAALKVLAGRRITSKLVANAIGDLERLVDNGVHTRLVWIKAHVNHEGNERADSLAKQGTEKSEQEIEETPVPTVFFANRIMQAADARWMEDWDRYPHARQTRQFFPSINARESKDLLLLGRRELSRMISVITGHGPFGYHQSLATPGTPALCRFCGYEQETFYHFATLCPPFLNRRLDYLGYREREDLSGWNVGCIVKFISNTEIGEIFDSVEAREYASFSEGSGEAD